MVAPLRTTTQVQVELARKIREAGRMTCVDPEFKRVHAEINDLLDELEMLGRA